MASTNKTTNYELSQFVGSDKPTYLGDYNGDMLKIDTQMKANALAALAADSKATTAGNTADTALTNAGTAQTTANTANNTATTALSKATTNESKLTNLTTYSTNETEIGLWIDGKPLYRKVIEYTPSNTLGEVGKTTNVDINHGITNIKYVVESSTKLFYTGYNITTDVPYIVGQTNTTNVTGAVAVNIINDTIVRLRIVNDTINTSEKIYITLVYTKTTD